MLCRQDVVLCGNEADGNAKPAELYSDSLLSCLLLQIAHTDGNYVARLINNYALSDAAENVVMCLAIPPLPHTDQVVGRMTTFCAIPA